MSDLGSLFDVIIHNKNFYEIFIDVAQLGALISVLSSVLASFYSYRKGKKKGSEEGIIKGRTEGIKDVIKNQVSNSKNEIIGDENVVIEGYKEAIVLLEEDIDILNYKSKVTIGFIKIFSDFDCGETFVDVLIFSQKIKDFHVKYEYLLEGFDDARKSILIAANLIQDYQTRQTRVGQLKVLAELHKSMAAFQAMMKSTSAPVGTTFEPLAVQWLKMIEDEQEKLHQQSTHNELPNPYIAGNPLEVRDQQLFVGRSDILLAIEQFILNAEQRPSLLLYGRRRTGKSSTLLNLPRSRFEPVYIDCQDAKWHESDQAFCYNLAHDLFNVLYQSDSVRGLRQPQIEQFDKNAFTQLDQFLTQAQKIADQRGKRILLAFDEYEELENSIINGDISEKVLGKLRNLIQHSKSIVVLVSGSHRFEELTRLNWANYLINTRTLELSYLDAESARELLTKPVPELHYEAGVVDDIIRITHCQPYLLQAVASELVNYLNSKQQTTATQDDLNTALEKTLVSASAYFSDTWRKDNSEAEQQVMRALATGKTESVLADAAFQPAIQSLIRKEIVEGTEGSYRLAVELFARWIVKNQV